MKAFTNSVEQNRTPNQRSAVTKQLLLRHLLGGRPNQKQRSDNESQLRSFAKSEHNPTMRHLTKRRCPRAEQSREEHLLLLFSSTVNWPCRPFSWFNSSNWLPQPPTEKTKVIDDSSGINLPTFCRGSVVPFCDLCNISTKRNRLRGKTCQQVAPKWRNMKQTAELRITCDGYSKWIKDWLRIAEV